MFKDNLKRFRKSRKARELTGDGDSIMQGRVRGTFTFDTREALPDMMAAACVKSERPSDTQTGPKRTLARWSVFADGTGRALRRKANRRAGHFRLAMAPKQPLPAAGPNTSLSPLPGWRIWRVKDSTIAVRSGTGGQSPLSNSDPVPTPAMPPRKRVAKRCRFSRLGRRRPRAAFRERPSHFDPLTERCSCDLPPPRTSPLSAFGPAALASCAARRVSCSKALRLLRVAFIPSWLHRRNSLEPTP